MRLYKERYHMYITDGGKVTAKEVKGYSFHVRVGDALMCICTHRDHSGNWELTEFTTGMTVAPCKYGTRREAVAYAGSADFAETMGAFIRKHPYRFRALGELFARVIDGEEITAADASRLVEARTAELVKADPESGYVGDGAAQAAEEESAEEAGGGCVPQAAEGAEPENSVETAQTVTVETLSEMFSGYPDIAVVQKNERSQITVVGNTKPVKEELKAMGFRWSSNRKFWWLKPQAA